MIAPPGNTQIWIAAGVTHLRRGFSGLSALVQTKTTVLVGLGQSERALDSLHQAFRLRCCRMAWLNVDPLLDKLRREVRFEALSQRITFTID